MRALINDAVIAIRGTEGIFEWVHDALYLQKPCPFAPIAQIPFYHHVGEVYTLQPFGPAPACQSLMQRTVKCHHVIESYLHLLYVAAGISPPYELTLDSVVPVGTTPRVPGTGIAVM
jgi:hypothetical protein